MNEPEPPGQSNKQALALIGQVIALLVAILCFLNSVWCLYDAAYAKGGGEWAGIGVLFTFAVNIIGCPISLLLAIFLKAAHRNLRVATILIAVAAFLLPFLAPQLKKARDEKRAQELTRDFESQRLLEHGAGSKKQDEAAEAAAGSH